MLAQNKQFLKWACLLAISAAILAAAAVLPVGPAALSIEAAVPKVIVLGFDGADPGLVTRFMEGGHLPNLQRLGRQGQFVPLATTRPSESPVSWSSFATGMNPGKTGIFDFLARVPGTYLPEISLSKQGTVPLLPETSLRVAMATGLGGGGFALVFLVLGLLLRANRTLALGLSALVGAIVFGIALYAIFKYLPRELPTSIATRKGVTYWKYTSDHGVRTVTLEAPVTFPAEELPDGKLLTGLGTPDIMDSWGFWSLYTTDLFEMEQSETAGTLFPIDFDEEGRAVSHIRGPRNFTVQEEERPEVNLPIHFALDREQESIGIDIPSGENGPITVGLREWSDWVELSFPMNPLISLHGMTRFSLLSVEPNVEIYMEPINWNPKRLPPNVRISHPSGYAGELADAIGYYETLGWSIATNPLKDEAIDYDTFLQDVDYVVERQRAMLFHELEQEDWQSLTFFFLFTDRVQHMLWRFFDLDHPVYDPDLAVRYGGEILEAYQEMDRIVGEVMDRYVDADTTLLVVSDHGFHSFRRGVNLNTWLVKSGLMTIEGLDGATDLDGLVDPKARFFPKVDWSRSKAYALGLSGIYLNVAGRERDGIVAPGAEYEEIKKEIIDGLMALVDPETGETIMSSATRREDAFQGPYVDDAYDIVVGFKPGYRVSWETTLGGIPSEVITDNRNNWSGDHCSSDANITAGVLFSNRRLKRESARIIDIAPTVLDLFGILVPDDMDGEPLL
jgi:predicted AlkP superfamily phosphohydrolase/phosphomutase